MYNFNNDDFLIKDELVIEVTDIENIFDKSILWLKKENEKNPRKNATSFYGSHPSTWIRC